MTCTGDGRIQIWRTPPPDRTDIAAEAGRDKVLVNHNNGAVAMTGPNEVTVYAVRVGCDRLDEWRLWCVQSQVSKRDSRDHSVEHC